MWIITGVLFAMVCLATAIGFHTGPHTHSVAVALGALGALWIAYVLVFRSAGPVMWSLLGADLVVAAGVGTLAWKGLSGVNAATEGSRLTQLEGLEGVAVNELAPEGIVRLRGEFRGPPSRSGATCRRAVRSRCTAMPGCVSKCGVTRRRWDRPPASSCLKTWGQWRWSDD